MKDIQMLVFEPGGGRYDFDADVVTFFGLADGQRVRCTISREALRSWGSRHEMADEAPEVIFGACHIQVEYLALRKFIDGNADDGEIVVSWSNLMA